MGTVALGITILKQAGVGLAIVYILKGVSQLLQ